MKKILLALMLIASSVQGVTNTVVNTVQTRDVNSPIISQSYVTSSNVFLLGTGTSSSNAVAYYQLTNAVVSGVSNNVKVITNRDPIVISQMYTNGINSATIKWATFLAPSVTGTCEVELWTSYAGSTNIYSAGLFSIPALGVLNTFKVPGSADLQPSSIFWFTNIQSSGTQFITNCFTSTP